MKLKISEPEVATPAAPQQGRAAIAARFQLDGDPNAKRGGSTSGTISRAASMIALISSLLAIAALGVVTWLLYQNWELIREV